ncbi:ribonuclease HI [Pseudodesulfovibrio portus]|uniref:Ribonuclease H n=1 Tax=Pseudodesulfovibrio portus TaxID=231439 RepID=A0ABM8AU27_9BACT|nr:ribonuclease HI [Pseudodesulfovibrio portus]BDQ34813.1 ribonuclease H [Pseudodesulfovibrio portus]
MKIYTDGACRGNQYGNATGGYGVIIDSGSARAEYAQGYADTTNNRMELRAAIAGLKALTTPTQVELVTDSQYVSKAFTDNWIAGWLKRGWKNASGKPVKNRDLWEELIPLTEKHKVTWTWVRGHNGHPDNERADELACMAADNGPLLKDIGTTTLTAVTL